MKKDYIRDYATEAFRAYARIKNGNDMPEKDNAGLMDDIAAVQKTIALLETKNKQYIVDALKSVYFVMPTRKPQKNELSERVGNFAVNHYVSERNIYIWLREARITFAIFRGLQVPADKQTKEIQATIKSLQ